jgi:hypothetical protein
VRTPIIYVAHPFGGNLKNLDKAEKWAAWLTERFDALFVVPWVPLCRHWRDSGTSLTRGIDMDKAAIARCDAMIAVGGGISRGMAIEIEFARGLGIQVIEISMCEDQGDFESFELVESLTPMFVELKARLS